MMLEIKWKQSHSMPENLFIVNMVVDKNSTSMAQTAVVISVMQRRVICCRVCFLVFVVMVFY